MANGINSTNRLTNGTSGLTNSISLRSGSSEQTNQINNPLRNSVTHVSNTSYYKKKQSENINSDSTNKNSTQKDLALNDLKDWLRKNDGDNYKCAGKKIRDAIKKIYAL